MKNHMCLYQENNPWDVSDNLYTLSSTAVTVNTITKLFFLNTRSEGHSYLGAGWMSKKLA